LTTDLFGDADLRERLRAQCESCERAVRDLMLSLAAQDVDAPVALQRCAIELHQLKDAVRQLGLERVADTVGSLCEVMTQSSVFAGDLFWERFATYFAALDGYVRAVADGRGDEVTRQALVARKNLLVSRLAGLPSHRPSTSVGAATPASTSSGLRLLVIDDSATLRAVISARLTDRGYLVRTARDLRETSRLLLDFDPEIVICDVQMPEVGGDEICRRLKTYMKRVVPVVLYSGLGQAELRERARSVGADRFVSKLQGIEALIKSMDELSSERASSDAARPLRSDGQAP